MQKAFIAIALALTLSCVAATYTVTEAGWSKKPVQVVQDSDLNFTNSSNTIELGPLTSTTDLNLIATGTVTPVDKNVTFGTWRIFTKAIATKDLSSSSNTSYAINAPIMATAYVSGYAVGFDIVNDTTTNSIPQFFLYQTKLEGNSALPRVQLTSNKNKDVNPEMLGASGKGKTLMMFVRYNQTVNGTSITIGTSTLGKDFSFTTTNATTINVEAGEALSSSQVYAGFKEGDNYKTAVVDFSSGTIAVALATISGYGKTMSCSPYVTDKKYYGVWCLNTTTDDKGQSNTTIFVTSTNTTLGQLFTFNSTRVSIVEAFPYSGYLGFFTSDANGASPVLSHEIWDLAGVKAFKNRTAYLTYETATAKQSRYRIPGAGIYGLVYNDNTTTVTNKTTVYVGLILSGSSLTTVFGFLMTIVAGLFLF